MTSTTLSGPTAPVTGTRATRSTSHTGSTRSSSDGRRGLFELVRAHLARRRHEAALRRHESEDRTDAYLDRGSAGSVDWGDALARHVAR